MEIVGPITNIEPIASGTALRERRRLWKVYGKGRWRKLKGIAEVEFPDGTICYAEIHWYEARHRRKRIQDQAHPRLI
jgi:hypothetical protein